LRGSSGASRGAESTAVFDIDADRSTVAEIAGDGVARDLDWRTGDIRATDEVERAARGCDGVIHLAGVLTPACSENPILGAEIDLIGTLNVFEAARQHRFASVVYAGSAGVFRTDDAVHPTTFSRLQAGFEGAVRHYDDHRLRASLRPLVVYGAGRERPDAGPGACRAAAPRSTFTPSLARRGSSTSTIARRSSASPHDARAPPCST
jgi:nucleoside-diphosphate-sugar epimerase